MPRERQPTEKELKYLNALADGKTPKQAVREAGYQNRAGVVLANLERQRLNEVVSGSFEDAGITLDSIAAKVAELMEAKERKAFVTRQGDVVYAEEQGLADIQLKATQTAADLLGLSPKARQAQADAARPGGDGVNILVLAQKFEGYTDEQLEEAMQLMRVGQFEGSALAKEKGTVRDPEAINIGNPDPDQL